MTILKTALNHIRRSPYQSILVVLTLSFSFFLISSFAVLGYASQRVLGFFEGKPQVIAYLDDKATPEQILALKNKLEATGKTKKVKYISKEDALKIYQKANKDNPLLLEMVTADILPASLEISATDISYLKDLANILEHEPIVSVSEGGKKEIDFQEDIAQSLRQWTQSIRTVGLGMGGFLVLESFLLILVITSMKIAMRHDEVEIIRLLGGSSWYARAPFLVEGMTYGFLGALLGFAAMYLALSQITPLVASFLGDIGIFPIPLEFLLVLLGATAAFSSLLCGLASFFATRRYLR